METFIRTMIIFFYLGMAVIWAFSGVMLFHGVPLPVNLVGGICFSLVGIAFERILCLARVI